MKLQLATDAVGGVWTYSVELACALRGFGVETVLASIGPPPDREQLAAAEGLRIIDTGLPLDWLAESPDEIRRAAKALSRLADEERADVVQVPSAAYAADPIFSRPVVAVQHSCLASWWSAVRCGPVAHDFLWRRELVGRGLRRADAVVAPTAAFAGETVRIYELKRPVDAVHNGRTPIALPRRRHADFVFTVGRLWDDGKNVRTLDEAAALIDVPVEAVGPLRGPNGTRAAFANLCTPGPLHGRAIAERLAACPIFASSALYEPFGLSALEAAQAGCALVLSDIPTFRELWEGAAVLVPPTDANGFARAITGLLRQPKARARLGQAAQLRAINYRREAMARRMQRIYEQVMPADVTTAPFALAGAA
jgi:glycosyltransferase involved in cell wall biosynthesis